jgi:hypothetical protein
MFHIIDNIKRHIIKHANPELQNCVKNSSHTSES